MIDTHSHIYLEEFDADRNDVVNRAVAAGLRHLVLPNVDLETWPQMLATHQAYPAYTSMAMGLHPTSVNAEFRQQLEQTRELLDSHKFVAVGEVGIDLYWDTTFRNEQMEAFDVQQHWAEERGLPVIIHNRDALSEITEVFANYSGTLPRCVFHSFGGTRDDVDSIRRFGDFYFGINGVVTFKNSRLSETLAHIGLDRILLETDCPYLTPVPYRGKRNESSYVPYIAAKIADTLGVSIDEVSRTTDRNALDLFRINI